VSIGLKSRNQKRVINLTQLRKNKRQHGQKAGRKKARFGDYIVNSAPDAVDGCDDDLVCIDDEKHSDIDDEKRDSEVQKPHHPDEIPKTLSTENKATPNETTWLDDKMINDFCACIKHSFPHTPGLQDVIHSCNPMWFDIDGGETLQIFNVNQNHWIVVSTIGRVKFNKSNLDTLVVDIYDSMGAEPLPAREVDAVCGILRAPHKYVKFLWRNTQRQKGGYDCGLFVLANVTSLVLGISPCKTTFLQPEMRTHMKRCSDNGVVTAFPSASRARRPGKDVSLQQVEIFCTCRRPSKNPMIECEKCNQWFHKSCHQQIPEAAWSDTTSWKCTNCV
jgi:hypothetical protein